MVKTNNLNFIKIYLNIEVRLTKSFTNLELFYKFLRKVSWI